MTDDTVATRESWQNHPMPQQREQILFQRTFTPDEYAKIKAGHIPTEMDDRWFAFFEEPWIYFHRSWTGYCIYQVRLEETPDGWKVSEAWVNRGEGQYERRNTEDYIEFLAKVFAWSLGV